MNSELLQYIQQDEILACYPLQPSIEWSIMARSRTSGLYSGLRHGIHVGPSGLSTLHGTIGLPQRAFAAFDFVRSKSDANAYERRGPTLVENVQPRPAWPVTGNTPFDVSA